MRSFNKVMLYGNLTSDPEVRPAKNGRPVSTFSIAANNNWKNKHGEIIAETDFHKIVAFGKMAEITSTYLKKGQPVLVSGKLKNRSYVNEKGEKRYITEVVLEDFNFMNSGRKKKEEEEAVAA